MWLFVATLMLSCQRSETGECNGKLTMPSKRIQDIDVTSSSELSSNHAPAFARLDGPRAWCSAPGDKTPYVQITWDEEKVITAMKTQGSFYDFSWARRYEVRYLTEEGEWTSYKKSLIGNRNTRALKKNYFKPAIRTQSVQIYPKNPIRVVMYSSAPVVPCLRLELYGCSAPVPDWETTTVSETVPNWKTTTVPETVPDWETTTTSTTVPDWETTTISTTVPDWETTTVPETVSHWETTTVPETVPHWETTTVPETEPVWEKFKKKLATSTPSPHPGKCPIFEPPAKCPDEAEHFCLSDDSCPTSFKCCNTGCELDCVVPDWETATAPKTVSDWETTTVPETEPVWEKFKKKLATSTPSPHPGKCPIFEPPAKCPDEVEHFCLSDYSCPTSLKCCNTGCELDCVVPEWETTTVPDTDGFTSSPRPLTSTSSV